MIEYLLKMARRLGPLALAIGIGLAGGTAFSYATVPLPWMLGSMTLTTIGSMAGLKLELPGTLRKIFITVIGVLLGSSFTPDFFAGFVLWASSLTGLAINSVAMTLAMAVYFRRVGGFDSTTAYFAGTPGGLNDMLIVGRAFGGDERAIALVHASRILFVVLTLPICFRLFGGYTPMPLTQGVGGFAAVPAADLAILLGCAIAGGFLGRIMRLPGAELLGPLLVSAAVHLSGLTHFRPPAEIVLAAQVVMGASVGCRFVGLSLRRVGGVLLLSAGSTFFMLVLSATVALVLSKITGLSFTSLMLAYAPGGVAEMSLVALAMGVDPGFISLHHLSRIILIVVVAPPLFRFLLARRESER